MKNQPTNHLGAKAVGKTKAAVAKLKGLSGVFNTLVEQHGEAGTLLKKAQGTEDAAQRAHLWSEIRVALLAHEKGELKAVYPVLSEYSELQPYVMAHAREAGELEDTIKALDAIEASSAAWLPKLVELTDMVLTHVDEEENQWFPKAIKAIGKDKAIELDPKFKAAHAAAEASL